MMNEYWDKRYGAEGRIWGDEPSRTAGHALKIFQKYQIKKILVPGAGYGRNTKLFSRAGFEVTGIEISPTATKMAIKFDQLTRFIQASVLDMSFLTEKFDAIYCFNVLHLFRENERKLFIQQCMDRTKEKGIMYFTVFSEKEESYRKGQEVEENTFESKPGRPVHYFTEEDLRGHFTNRELIGTGTTEDPEDHGGGPHTHILRFICVRNNP
jgi:SAM-dependent methyltransferase